jgi:hypothetical protein
MFHVLAFTVFGLVVKPQVPFSPMVTAELTVICIIVVLMALRGERRRG